MGQGPLCYILKFMEIVPLVPKKKILKAFFYHRWTRKPSGRVKNINYIFSFPCTKKSYIQNLVKKVKWFLRKTSFSFVNDLGPK